MNDRYTLPEKGDENWHVPLNENFEAIASDIDSLEKSIESTESSIRGTDIVVFNDRGTTRALDSGGEIDASSDAAAVITSAVSALGDVDDHWTTVRLYGDMEISETIDLSPAGNWNKLIVDGKLTLADGVNDHMFTLTDGAGWWQIYGGRFDGNRSNNTEGSCFRFDHSGVNRVFNCHVRDFPDAGVSETNSGNMLWIEQCYFLDNEFAGIALNSSGDTIIRGNQIGGGEYGLYLTGGNSTVAANQIFLARRNGIYASGHNYTITGGRVNHCGRAGIRVEADRTVVTNIDLISNGQSGSQDWHRVGVIHHDTEESIVANVIGNNEVMDGLPQTQNYVVWAGGDFNIYDNIIGVHEHEGAVAGSVGSNSGVGITIE